MWVVSAVSRETSSPVRARVVEGGVEAGQMGEHVAAEVGDHPFAERRHEIVPDRGRERDDEDDHPHRQEVDVDRPAAVFGEAEVDHPAEGEGDRQGRSRGRRQRRQGGDRPALVAAAVGEEREERAEGSAFGHSAIHRRFRDETKAKGAGRRSRLAVGGEIAPERPAGAAIRRIRRFSAGLGTAANDFSDLRPRLGSTFYTLAFSIKCFTRQAPRGSGAPGRTECGTSRNRAG